ncbi:hypothetical protein C8R45DRAFT_1144348 [Mycena sanguinolenta]|nr:hypothetical protein C8R45DRAFT_1144348 [Mycena sanguinolenta]
MSVFPLTTLFCFYSLLAARIRRGMMGSRSELDLDMPEIAIPNDAVFTFSTIGKLAAFGYGVVFARRRYCKGGMKYVPVSILDRKDAYMQTHFNMVCGGIQVRDYTLSFVVRRDLYYRKIKQPTGPTRRACRIAKLLDSKPTATKSDLQLALIDSSPFAPLDPSYRTRQLSDNDLQSRHVHHERSVQGVSCIMLRGGPMFAAGSAGRGLRPEDMTELIARMYENLIRDDSDVQFPAESSRNRAGAERTARC